MSQLTLEQYSDKSIVVRGDTRPFKDIMMENGGRWNPNLQGGGGYIFSNSRYETLQPIIDKINSGEIKGAAVVTYKSKNVQSTPLIMPQVSQLPGFQSGLVLPIDDKRQTLTYSVEKPFIGNKVIIEIDGNRLETIITQVLSGNDKIILKYIHGGQEMLFEAGVYAGEWKIRTDQRPHKLIFE